MTGFDLRMALRLHRFELLGFGALVGLLALAGVVVAAELDATGYGARCLARTDASTACAAIGRRFYDLQQAQANPVQGILAALPFLLAALVGAPLVAREVERGTSRLAWSLAPSRLAWFVARVIPALGAVLVVSLVAGLALDRLMGAIEPSANPFLSFSGFGGRGGVLAARAVFVFAVGVAVGAVSGRVLPALVLTAVIGYIGLAGGSSVHARMLASEAVVSPTSEGSPGDLFVDQRVRTPDGRVVTWDELNALVPPPVDGSEWPPAGYTYVAIVVPGQRYPFAQAREVGALAGGSLVALGLAAAVVGRRRPG